jgi:serine/threonine-protein kinase HipA
VKTFNCRIDTVANVSLTGALHKDVLLIERYDRVHTSAGRQCKIMVSARTMLSLDETMARYASCEDLAEIVRHRFTDAPATLRELYSRLVFNILCGNTDDHARDHAAFWDGEMLTLTPAYDICPQGRTGNEAAQAMLIAGNNRMSSVSSCLEAAAQFHLSRATAIEIVECQFTSIIEHWDPISDEASLSAADRGFLWGRQFLNPYAFENINGDAAHLKALADKAGY